MTFFLEMDGNDFVLFKMHNRYRFVFNSFFSYTETHLFLKKDRLKA